MIKKIFLLSVIFTKSLSLASANEEILGCSLFNYNGVLQEEYRTKLSTDKTNNTISNITIERKFFYSDLLIYKKGTNELVGSKINLPKPDFATFEEWSKKCMQSELRKCDEVEYQNAKQNYENDPRWIVRAYQIQKDDKFYYTLNTKFVVLQTSSNDVDHIGEEGSYKRYESKYDSLMKHFVFVSNQNQNMELLQYHELNSKITFLDNPKSYSLTISRSLPGSKDIISDLTTSLVCNKL